jgi:hypothetical protein
MMVVQAMHAIYVMHPRHDAKQFTDSASRSCVAVEQPYSADRKSPASVRRPWSRLNHASFGGNWKGRRHVH